jgi:hypothetical protein
MKKTVKLIVLVNFLLMVILFTFKPYDAKADTDFDRDLKVYVCGVSPSGVMIIGFCEGSPIEHCSFMACATVLYPGPIITPPNN